jgi:hypothetical protein
MCRGFSAKTKTQRFMEIRLEFLQLLHEVGRTEINKITKGTFLYVSFSNFPVTITQSMYIAADCGSHRDTVPVMFSVLLYSTFTVQTVQSTAELYLR